MAYFNFLSIDQIRALPVDQRNKYIQWLAAPDGYDQSGHGGSLINLVADKPDFDRAGNINWIPGDWNELAYQLPSMQREIQKSEDKAIEYAQRVKEYEANGVEPARQWEGEARSALGDAITKYKNAPDFAKGETPTTFEAVKAKVPAVNPYDTPGGVVYDKEQAAKQGSTQAPDTYSFDAGGNLVLPGGQRISPQDPNWETYTEQARQSGLAIPEAPMTPEIPADVTGGGTLGGGATGGSTGGATGGGSTIGGIDTTGMPPYMVEVLSGIQTLADEMLAQGKRVNPDVVIDDATVQRFLEQAKTELGPYYRQQFQQTEDDLKVGFEQLKQDQAKRELALSKQYGQQLEQTQESYAQRGLTFGTARDKAEAGLADTYSSALEDAMTQSTRSGLELGTKGERTLGSANFPQIDTSVAAGTKPILNQPGVYGFNFGTSSRSLFNPIGGTTGTLERTRLFDEESRKQELTSAEREYRAANYL